MIIGGETERRGSEESKRQIPTLKIIWWKRGRRWNQGETDKESVREDRQKV